jgi:hypothetical protein
VICNPPRPALPRRGIESARPLIWPSDPKPLVSILPAREMRGLSGAAMARQRSRAAAPACTLTTMRRVRRRRAPSSWPDKARDRTDAGHLVFPRFKAWAARAAASHSRIVPYITSGTGLIDVDEKAITGAIVAAVVVGVVILGRGRGRALLRASRQHGGSDVRRGPGYSGPHRARCLRCRAFRPDRMALTAGSPSPSRAADGARA